MATIHFTERTPATPEQFVASLTDFGPGRRELFPNSADEYLQVHAEGSTTPTSPRVRAAYGNGCDTTGPTRTAW